MNKSAILALLIGIYTSDATPSPLSAPCERHDQDCLNEIVNNIIRPSVFGLLPEMEIESLDPMFVPEVLSDIYGFKYKFSNSTWVGYSKCLLSNIKINKMFTKIDYDIDCPPLKLNGLYEMSGEILSLPVQGNGEFEIITGEYQIHFMSDLVITKDDSGKSHLKFQNYKLTAVALSPMSFDFKNMSEEFHKLVHENWKLVGELFDGAIWYTCLGKVVENFNKYFQTVPLDNLIKL